MILQAYLYFSLEVNLVEFSGKSVIHRYPWLGIYSLGYHWSNILESHEIIEKYEVAFHHLFSYRKEKRISVSYSVHIYI